jgi:hypothetical protein
VQNVHRAGWITKQRSVIKDANLISPPTKCGGNKCAISFSLVTDKYKRNYIKILNTDVDRRAENPAKTTTHQYT